MMFCVNHTLKTSPRTRSIYIIFKLVQQQINAVLTAMSYDKRQYLHVLTGLIEENDTLLQQLSQISESVAIKETS